MENLKYIAVKEEKRKELIKILKEKNYNIADEVMDCNLPKAVLPIVVDIEKKEVSVMDTITSAACAASEKILISVEEFLNAGEY